MPTIWAIGRNYKDHALEMKAELPKEPLVFLKSEGGLSTDNSVLIPSFTKDLQHEIELAVRLGPLLIPSEVALAIDLTARDIQSELKAKGLPWALAKSFKNSCPVSPWIPFESHEWFSSLQFSLAVNGQKRQQGKVKDMIFELSELIAFLNEKFPVTPGDIILTGTPAGVGSLKSGDHLNASIEGWLDWSCQVTQL